MRSIFSFVLVFYTLVVFGQDDSIPFSIQVPLGSRLIWHTYAKGVQVYVCTQDPKDSTYSPDSGAIPWLLLKATLCSGTGRLTPAMFIQRIRTKGGKAPATGDRQNKGQSVEVAYFAEYIFYSEK
jgi:hypothetical protein